MNKLTRASTEMQYHEYVYFNTVTAFNSASIETIRKLANREAGTVFVSVKTGRHPYSLVLDQDGSDDLTTTAGVQYTPTPRGAEEYTTTQLGVGLDGASVAQDTAALQAALWYVSGKQGTLINDRITRYNAELLIPYNVTLKAAQPGFTNRLIPQDCPAFKMDGSDPNIPGNSVFRDAITNIMFDMTECSGPLPYCGLMENTYRSKIVSVQFNRPVVNETTGFASVMKSDGFLLSCEWDDIQISGPTVTNVSGRGFDFNNTGMLKCTRLDPENCFSGFYYGPNCAVDNYSCYGERCAISHHFVPATDPDEPHVVNVIGGLVSLSAASSIGFYFQGADFGNGEMINIQGVRWISDDKATKNNGVAIGAFNWNNEHPIVMRDMDWSWVKTPDPKLLAATYYSPQKPGVAVKNDTFTEALADVTNGATSLFTLSGITGVAPYTPVQLRIKAFATHNGYSRMFEVSEWIVSDYPGSGDMRTTKVVTAADIDSFGGNYSVTEFDVTATEGPSSTEFFLNTTFSTNVLTELAEVFYQVDVIGDATISVT